jgi:hypothetical protein
MIWVQGSRWVWQVIRAVADSKGGPESPAPFTSEIYEIQDLKPKFLFFCFFVFAFLVFFFLLFFNYFLFLILFIYFAIAGVGPIF